MPHSAPSIRVLGAGLSGLSAAIVLARAGRAVDVYEHRSDTGERFGGDFQAIENWTSATDFFDEMGQWGIATDTFKSTTVREIDVLTAEGRVERARTHRIACRVVRRGVEADAIDQGLKRQALDAGVRIHYRARRAVEDCDIIATGPRHATGAVRAELFHTDYPNHIALQFDDALAPGAYTYLVVIDGVGLIATVLMERRLDMDERLDATIASYGRHYPALRREPLRRMTGIGCFAMSRAYDARSRYYVGEAAGLQDCFWGFGIRYAITSGCLAAQALLGGADYGPEVRRRLRPLQVASLANRWLLDTLGPRGLAWLSRAWMWHQRRCGDGLEFVSRLYRPSWLHQVVYGLFGRRLLVVPARRDDGRGLRYVPFREGRQRAD